MTKKILKHLWAKILAGILVTLPLGITILVLNFVFNLLDNILGPLMPQISFFLFDHKFLIPGLGILGFFVLLYLFGTVATNFLGRELVSWGDRIFTTIPVVKNIYSASKQLTDAFSATRSGSFRQAVFVEFPKEGNYMLGFVTNEMNDQNSQARVTVFVPTAFVPPQGFLLFLPKEQVFFSRMSIEEAIKTIMSVGIVAPSSLYLPVPGTIPDQEANQEFRTVNDANSKTEGGP